MLTTACEGGTLITATFQEEAEAQRSSVSLPRVAEQLGGGERGRRLRLHGPPVLPPCGQQSTSDCVSLHPPGQPL